MKTFFLVLRQVPLPEGESERSLPARAAKRLGCPAEDIVSWRTLRKSLDARKRHKRPRWMYHIRLELPMAWRKKIRLTPGLDIVIEKRAAPLFASDPSPAGPARSGVKRPLVVGAGPAGLFAALRLARAGWRPILIERGDALAERRRNVAAFWKTGVLLPESNPLFGIGGAGLFSDGKLNTRHKDREGIQTILHALVNAGAPEEIRIQAEPHLGSDLLGDVVERLIREIRDLGGEVRHGCRLERLILENGALRGVELADPAGSAAMELDACVLAIGHSARDAYAMLHREGVRLEAKPFAVGLRVEMPQTGIDESQRSGGRRPGRGADAASFRLSRRPAGAGGACYTFCMCPGGMVIACASEPGHLAVNGMSYHARAGDWGNAAFLSPVSPEDFASALDGEAEAAGPLAGVAFQRVWERKAYLAGLPGGGYAIPASGLDAFVRGERGEPPGERGSSRAAGANLRELLPPRIGDTLAAAIPGMLSRLRRVDLSSVILYGVETRTSSPLRILRGETGASVTARGVYPAGEGAGYAGGITTSALDGWKAAGCLMADADCAESQRIE